MTTRFINGRVYSPDNGFTDSFAVKDGVFISPEEAGADAETVDLQGRFVCPGFTDTHMHLVGYGRALCTCDLAEHTGSLSEMTEFMKDTLKKNPPAEGEWFFARGWNEDMFTDVHRPITCHDLDLVSTEVPVYAGRTCGHCVCVNSKALEILGITPETKAPSGGRIGVENGELTGMFYDNAMNMLRKNMKIHGKEEIKKYIRVAVEKLNSFGVTSSMTDDFTALYRWQEVTEAYREMEKEGTLHARIYQQCYFDTPEGLLGFVNAGNTTGAGSDWYRIGPLKMIADGAVGAHSAFLTEPYSDRPETRGSMVYDQKTLDEMIGLANRLGMQVAIHAIGDACLDMVLSAYEKAFAEHERKDHRDTLMHCLVTRPDQLPRIKKLGLRVHYQTAFLDYHCHIAKLRLGEKRAMESYAWKSMKEMGIPVSNSSDAPVEVPSPMRGIQLAVTRQPLDQSTEPLNEAEAFTLSEAIAGYTTEAVTASFEENIRGRILPGFLADFVVLEKNPFDCDPKDLAGIRVLETWLSGKKVYERTAD